jgi:uncharacterized membrane protein
MRFKECGERCFDHITPFLALFAIVAVLYAFRLGSWSLGASEAYSALAASQGSVSGVIQQALRFDPGKPPFYQILLHYFVGLFGNNETSLRAFSAIFALVALLPLYSLGLSMFGSGTALATVAIWAVNPVAFVLGQWARMYSIFIAAVLMSMLTFWRMRERASKRRIAAYAVCTALVLYTHLCGLLFVGIETAVLSHDLSHGRRALRPWAGLALALAFFLPFLPREATQARELLVGHWLDWIGIAHLGWSLRKSMTALAAALVMLTLIFAPQFERDDREPVWFCMLWLIIPIAGLGAISIIARPVFALRYIAPAVPGLALLVARALGVFGARVRNLSTAGIAMAFAVLFFFCKAVRYEPWRDIARQIAAAGPAQPVFFESPLVKGFRGRAEVDAGFDPDFPAGYFKVPFDYYFKGPNPRCVIDPFELTRARQEIGGAALRAGGAWLISGNSDAIARLEMPESTAFRISRLLHTADTSVYHLVLRPQVAQ